MSVYSEVLATGGYIANHESDLYIEDNEVNREILARHPLEKSNARTFQNQVTGKRCLDVPFGYDPFWDRLTLGLERRQKQRDEHSTQETGETVSKLVRVTCSNNPDHSWLGRGTPKRCPLCRTAAWGKATGVEIK